MAADAPIFAAEYERELERWLRRRFAWLLGATMLMRCIGATAAVVALIAPRTLSLRGMDGSEISATSSWIILGASAVTLGLCAWFMWRVRPTLHTRKELLRAASLFVLLTGINGLAMQMANGLLVDASQFSSLSELALRYLIACLFLPWTIRESLRPMWPLLALYALSQVVFAALGGGGDPAIQVDAGSLSPVAQRWLAAAAASLVAPLVLLPGLCVCWWRMARHRHRFRTRMLDRSFRSTRHELAQARAVLASLFPEPVQLPGVSFHYAHVPADEVGGDYLHSSVDAHGRLRLVLLDVSGHGLAAAMTVARLSGEIERIIAEEPDIGPGALLGRLNRYCLLTISRQGIHATGVALHMDARLGEARYASAGHPPVLRRRGDGSVQAFDSTTTVLGAVEEPVFETDDHAIPMAAGDTLLLYTDGLTEARDGRERMFGQERLDASFSRDQAPADWSAHLVQLIDSWRSRVAEDDLLVAEIRWDGQRSVGAASPMHATEVVA